MVVLLTTATLLRQPGIAQSTRYSVSFAAGNAAGAALAAFATLMMAAQGSALLLLAITAACSLLLAGQIVRGPLVAAVFIPASVAFTMLFGLTLSPILPIDDVDVLGRVLSIVAAALYALGGASIMLPLVRPRRPPRKRRPDQPLPQPEATL